MSIAILAVIAGLALLVWSADKFVMGASATAQQMGVSPLVIGMLIIGFGTSAPELIVSLQAALEGNPGLALGNAVGSNIANISLILGATALMMPIAVQSRVIKREIPLLLGIAVLLFVLMWDFHLGVVDGIILLVLLFGIIGFNFWEAQHSESDAYLDELEEELPPEMPMKNAVIWTVVGLLLLVGSSKLLVWGAVSLAQTFGVSDLVIGLTIVAIGTSLPELASSIAAARKGEAELAIGNVVGSNLFNSLGVIGIPGVLAPFAVDHVVLHRDLPIMTGLTVLMLFMALGRKGPGQINRWEGVILLLMFVGYQALLFNEQVS
ncbi:calcium/sodium antiporter [Terasakiispira papahanaumokuakeensis]|uniref:Calcium/sodium antiporter n=1 Tax=Terasakiispira papahanaumokuakeensis TaxID=197479 RepID=A0A1E2VAH2_9GAMM|nr:calcium/sodium antiporter [Terasakiispira papahanaumokuakeensis]ODC03645.1 calcium/sodium antiporter [Terasakiispira papahanaumokuakeensis]